MRTQNPLIIVLALVFCLLGGTPLSAIPIPGQTKNPPKPEQKSDAENEDDDSDEEEEEEASDDDEEMASTDEPESEEEAEEESAEPEPHVVTAPEWDLQLDFDSQIFPSYLIATATMVDHEPDESLLGDSLGVLGISITVPKENTKVKVTIKANKLMEAASWSGVIPQANKTYYISPKIPYNFDALAKVRQQTPISITFDVEIDGGPVESRTATATLHSINDCPFGVAESEQMGSDNSGYEDMGWMFAAYVNESHPWIDKVLKDALSNGIVNSFDGYQSGDPDQVLAQMYAIWDVFHRRGVKYSSITKTPNPSKLIYSQHIRFLEECTTNNQANCADGSVLFASILRKLSLNSFLVIVPGHMYIGVVLGKDNIIGLETTALGVNDVQLCEAVDSMVNKLPKDKRKLPSLNTFAAAVKIGTADLDKHKNDFGNEEKPDYQLIDVQKSRSEGVMPIPYNGEH